MATVLVTVGSPLVTFHVAAAALATGAILLHVVLVVLYR